MPEPNILKQLIGLQGETLICDRESLGFQKSCYFRLWGRAQEKGQTAVGEDQRVEGTISKMNKRPLRLYPNERYLERLNAHTYCGYSFWSKLLTKTVKLAVKVFSPLS